MPTATCDIKSSIVKQTVNLVVPASSFDFLWWSCDVSTQATKDRRWDSLAEASLTFRSPAEMTDTASTSLPSSALSTVKVRVTTELCLTPSWEVARALIVTWEFTVKRRRKMEG